MNNVRGGHAFGIHVSRLDYIVSFLSMTRALFLLVQNQRIQFSQCLFILFVLF